MDLSQAINKLMFRFLNSIVTSSIRRAAMVVASATFLMTAAHAGTYSIIGVEWFPAPIVSSGAYMNFSSANPLDVVYGFSAGAVAAPNSSITPSLIGGWRWKIQWVANPGDNIPSGVDGTVEVAGSASASAGGTSYVVDYTGGGSASITDLYNMINTISISDASGSGEAVSTQANVPFNRKYATIGVGPFTLVSGNTYVGYASDSASAQGTASAVGYTAHHGFAQWIYASGSASIALANTLRLTIIDGQRVQPDL